MTYKQLRNYIRKKDKKIDRLHDEISELEKNYIKEHAPLQLSRGDYITIKLRVTEETQKRMQPKYQQLPRYQPGHIYYVRGQFCRWLLWPDGEIRPVLMGSTYYPGNDEIISITPTRKRV